MTTISDVLSGLRELVESMAEMIGSMFDAITAKFGRKTFDYSAEAYGPDADVPALTNRNAFMVEAATIGHG